jgi:heat shock protein HslJ/membrane-bound inhibitor of C-type lysozyme
MRPLAAVAALSAWACTASRPAGGPGEQPPNPAVPALPDPAPSVTGSTVYACTDLARFSVRSVGDALVLALPERTDTLVHVEAASGARYAGKDVVFWSKGEEATLDMGGAHHTGCHGRRAGDAWEEAALMGVEFRAVGQEPGWVLDLVDGRWVRYVGDYGATRVYAASPQQVRGAPPGTTAYAAEPEGRNLRVEIREQPCQDAMSGASFTHAVTVRLDGRAVAGCGRMTPPGELTNKYWKLTELDGRPVTVGVAREPHLRFQAADSHVAGSTGCNSLSGTFERHGDRLTFGRLVTTVMACADPALASQERHLLALLATVDRAATVGDRLTLYAHDRPVARFDAVYFH